MDLLNLSVKDFLNTVDAPTPAPGGGSVSALAIAQGISLIRMVAHLTMGKKKFKALSEDEQNVFLNHFNQLGVKKETVLELVEKDTDAYNEVLNAYRLPKETDEENRIRQEAIQQATLLATETPLQTALTGEDAMKLSFPIIRYGLKSAASDFLVGLLLIEAGIKGAILNVKTNLPTLTNHETVQRVLETTNAIETDVSSLIQQAQSLITN